MEVSKSDWKLFRACIGDWQEAYMERLVKEYMDLFDKERIVGIEVTEAVTIEEAKIESEFVKYRLENDNSKKERKRQIIENNEGRIEKFGLS